MLSSSLKRALLILGVVAGVYANSLGNGWHYDDKHAITENPGIRDLGRAGEFFRDPSFFSRDADKAMYRPLLLLTFAANYAWGELDVASYHVVNILIHGLASLLVWQVLLAMGVRSGAALVGALIFAAHPVGTEPANYISSRSESLAALFVLASVLLYQRVGGSARPSVVRAASVLCFALGLLCKSIAITLPGLLVLLDMARGRDMRRAISGYLPYAAIAIGYVLVVSTFLHRAVVGERVRTVAEQLGTQVKAGAYYLKLLALPMNLNVHHQFFVSVWSPAVLFSGLALASLVYWGWRGRRDSRAAFVGVGWMLVTLAPTAVVPLYVLVNDHRLYLPLVGAIIFITGALEVRYWYTRVSVVALLVLGVLSFQRNEVWLDEYTLWTDALHKSPYPLIPVAYIHLGNYAKEHGELEEAIGHFQHALEIAPGHVAARNNMGTVFQMQGEYAEAIQVFESLLADDPDLAEAHHNLGKTYQDMGNYARAIESYGRVTTDSYHYDAALNNLGTAFEELGRPDSAAVCYRRALALRPEARHPSENLARLSSGLAERAPAMCETGQILPLEGLCRELLLVRGEDRFAAYYLAVSLFLQGRYAESIQVNTALVQQHPGFAEGYLQLGNAYETVGEIEAARRVYEEQLRRNPQGDLAEDARQRLGRLAKGMARGLVSP